MKVLILAVVIAAAAAFPGDWPGFPRKRSVDKRDTQANMDDYADAVIAQVVQFMKLNNYDPMPLTDQYLYNFPITDLIGLTWNTRMGLYDGSVKYLTTLHRADNATLSYSTDLRDLNMDIGVMFDRMDVGYHYAAQLISFGPKGSFTAIIKKMKAEMDITVNLKTLKATLNDFKLGEAASIKVDVKGLTLIGDWAVEAFANTFLKILKKDIFKVIENKVRSAMENAVGAVDAAKYIPTDSA